MENKDYKIFAVLMATLAEVFSLNMPKTKIALYFRFLKDLPLKDIEVNVDHLIKTRVYTSFPTIAEIRGEGGLGGGEGRALEAFLTLWSALKGEVGYESAEFDDPIIHSVIECLGGLPFICENWFLEDMQWRQKEFLQLYRQFERRKKHPSYLPGILELGNLATGHSAKSPKIIRSQRVIEKEEEEKEKLAIEDKSIEDGEVTTEGRKEVMQD